MVGTFATNRSDQPFCETVLPRRPWGNGLVADAHGSYSARDGSAVDSILVTDQVARGLIPGEGLGNLLRDPFCRRVRRDVDPDKLSTRQPDDHQNIEQVKADGWNHEPVHGRDVRRMIAQEGAPALR